jgi:hypothetical protein
MLNINARLENVNTFIKRNPNLKISRAKKIKLFFEPFYLRHIREFDSLTGQKHYLTQAESREYFGEIPTTSNIADSMLNMCTGYTNEFIRMAGSGVINSACNYSKLYASITKDIPNKVSLEESMSRMYNESLIIGQERVRDKIQSESYKLKSEMQDYLSQPVEEKYVGEDTKLLMEFTADLKADIKPEVTPSNVAEVPEKSTIEVQEEVIEAVNEITETSGSINIGTIEQVTIVKDSVLNRSFNSGNSNSWNQQNLN